jgi:prepilin-type N-terminal cleavage/methylation domain-containing protein
MTNKSIKSGFTLIETLVAVLLLTTALAGPLTIAARSLVAASSAKDQITAYYLAQDAIEYVRFARDTNRLSCGDWLTGAAISGCAPYISNNTTDLSSCVSSGGTTASCYVDSRASTVTSCSGNVCPPIKYNSTAGLNYFTYSSGSATIFTRKVAITNPFGSQPDEAQIAVTVSWTTANGVAKSTTIQENIFNWQ